MKLALRKSFLKALALAPSKRIAFAARTSLALLALTPSQLSFAGGSDSGIIKPFAMTIAQLDVIKFLSQEEPESDCSRVESTGCENSIRKEQERMLKEISERSTLSK